MEKFTMSLKEINQGKVFDQIIRKEKTQSQGALVLKMSVRQLRKKLKRYKQFGNQGLIHKSRGRPSPKRLSKDLIEKIIEFYDSKYSDFGPTLFAEMLKEHHGINLSAETLRKYMIQKGRWKKLRKHKAYRKRRERKEHPGIMLQVDGSPFAWFEERGPICSSLIGVDDATSELFFCELHEVESTKNYMIAFNNYLREYGRPHSIYTDHHGTFSVNLNNPEREKSTQFGRAMKQLDITIILANSPQAKGRVERMNKTLQDILVKFLRINNISDITSANRFIREFFIPYFNKKFSKRTSAHVDMHRSIYGYDLDDILSIQETRILGNDFTINFHKRILQLDKQQLTTLRPKDEISIQERLDGTTVLKIRNILLSYKEIGMRNIGRLSPVEFVNFHRVEEELWSTFLELPKTINNQGVKNV